MTLALVGHCARTGMLGAVITSSSPAVAARCAYVRAGVGAVCTQNITDPRLGPKLLDLLASGLAAAAAIEALVADEPLIAYRQLAVVDAGGRAAAYSGPRTLGTYATATGQAAAAAGNLLRAESVPAAMLDAFQADPGADLGDRLLAGLAAGLEAGGEAGPVHSAGLLLAREVSWPVADLRVDWSDTPAAELSRLWARWQPQLADYVTRALDPATSPAYGVPGDSGEAVRPASPYVQGAGGAAPG